jgi:hypothetical protein
MLFEENRHFWAEIAALLHNLHFWWAKLNPNLRKPLTHPNTPTGGGGGAPPPPHTHKKKMALHMFQIADRQNVDKNTEIVDFS